MSTPVLESYAAGSSLLGVLEPRPLDDRLVVGIGEVLLIGE